MRWTLDEDIRLLTLIRQHFTSFIKHPWLDASTQFSQQLHTAFDSSHRDVAALLYRLRFAGILTFAGPPIGNTAPQRFKCLLQDDLPLYDYSVTLPTLKEPLHPATVAATLTHFDESNVQQPISDTIGEIASKLNLAAMQVEKTLIEHHRLQVNSYRQLAHSQASTHQGLSFREQLREQTPDSELIDDINDRRARAAELYQVHEREGAEVIFSADGTGFGKSYGVIQSYVDYLTQLAKSRPAEELVLQGDFTNLLFMSPQKSQIDLDSQQKAQIREAGGDLICVLSRQDIVDLDFIDWASGLTNRERYQQ